ncbi:class I SAM-dependent methyltransferase [Fictibacillus enclensis]|uniref:class I SAM-dependent methyltransferase n=1 Tax=Fictibacillus enclensis TaxID=1017270 RepID=UPI0024BF268A|nr:class I SAM-dependent methyltransferase [Fictibacillus enclensis]WHY73657.1 class I SAM-dependent methyltransferase [Fictibacillus enclensis]
MADEIFENPRLASIYDPFDSDRSDLDVYESMVNEFDAHTVLDIGCGTGTFACRLAVKGFKVIGLDPAEASLKVAKTKQGADRVRWIHGSAFKFSSIENTPYNILPLQ